MKKLLLTTALVAGMAFAGSAQADSTGCGAGTMIFKGKDGIVFNVLAVTTNGTLGNQTFGITSGTLGCNQNDVIASREQKVKSFASVNMERLAADVAKGEGENLESLAAILEVKEQDKARFFKVAKANFSKIYSSENIDSNEVVIALNDILKSDEVLKQYALA